MPCTIKIRVAEGRDLPVMDRSSKLTDAYVEVSFGAKGIGTGGISTSSSAFEPTGGGTSTTLSSSIGTSGGGVHESSGSGGSVDADARLRTKVARKSLNPKWDEEFRLDVTDDSLLQTCPLEFKVMDKDVYTSDDTIGLVYVDLNPLLLLRTSSNSIDGWFPIYDTIAGVRGELRLVIRLTYFGDLNPFLNSSAGVHLFGLSTLDPAVYQITQVLGFVEELVVHADPEYSWSDTFRTSRKSNQHRQLLLYKLASQVGTMVGKKALELGGNAVLAYHQYFDVEGDSGIVARASGTACIIATGSNINDQHLLNSSVSSDDESEIENSRTPHADTYEREHDHTVGVSDLSSSPKIPHRRYPRKKRASSFDFAFQEEIHLLTLKAFPPDTRVRLGGIVQAHSVKFLGKLATNLADQETRDSWWAELREEIRSHAQTLQCPYVIGYAETCTIYDDVCLLSASGTAAVVKHPSGALLLDDMTPAGTALGLNAAMEESSLVANGVSGGNVSPNNRHLKHPHLRKQRLRRHTTHSRKREKRKAKKTSQCSTCHIPYSRSLAPFSSMRLVRCGFCSRKWVPEVLVATIEPPPGLTVMGEAQVIQARVCRQHHFTNSTAPTKQQQATIVSDALPFLQYELYRQLMVKMKVMGVNAVFRLESEIQIGGSLIVGLVTGTAMYLPALPPPPLINIVRNIAVKDEEDRRLVVLQAQIEKLSATNRSEIQKSDICTIPASNVMESTTHQSSLSSSPKVRKSSSISEDDEKNSTIKKSTKKKVDKKSRKSLEVKNAIGPAEEEHIPYTSEFIAPDTSSSSDSSSDSNDEVIMEGHGDSKDIFVLEIDDETDEDILSVLLEEKLPKGISVCNTEYLPGSSTTNSSNIHMVLAVKRVQYEENQMRGTRLNQAFAHIFKEVFASLIFKVSFFSPCVICGLKTRVALAGQKMIEVIFTGMVLSENIKHDFFRLHSLPSPLPSSRLMKEKDEFIENKSPNPINFWKRSNQNKQNEGEWVELTPLSYVPGARVIQHLGRVNLHFIKESWTVRETGGLGVFFNLFLSEATAVARSHVMALGGNAMLAYRLMSIESSAQVYRNQVYNMITITGDAVRVQYYDSVPLQIPPHINEQDIKLAEKIQQVELPSLEKALS